MLLKLPANKLLIIYTKRSVKYVDTKNCFVMSLGNFQGAQVNIAEPVILIAHH